MAWLASLSFKNDYPHMMILKCWKAERRTFESPLEAFGILWSGHRFVDILPNAMDECAGQHFSPFNRHIWGKRSRSWGNKRHKLLDCFFRERHGNCMCFILRFSIILPRPKSIHGSITLIHFPTKVDPSHMTHLTGASHGGSSWKSVLCRSECPSHRGRSSLPVPKQQLQTAKACVWKRSRKPPQLWSTGKWWSTSGWNGVLYFQANPMFLCFFMNKSA